MEELFSKDWLAYKAPKFGSFKWLEAQSGYQKIGKLIEKDSAIKTALKDMICMSVQSAMENIETTYLSSVMPKNFKERRLNLKMSMDAVTVRTGISKPTISRIERGGDAYHRTIVKLDKFYSDNES